MAKNQTWQELRITLTEDPTQAIDAQILHDALNAYIKQQGADLAWRSVQELVDVHERLFRTLGDIYVMIVLGQMAWNTAFQAACDIDEYEEPQYCSRRWHEIVLSIAFCEQKTPSDDQWLFALQKLRSHLQDALDDLWDGTSTNEVEIERYALNLWRQTRLEEDKKLCTELCAYIGDARRLVALTTIAFLQRDIEGILAVVREINHMRPTNTRSIYFYEVFSELGSLMQHPGDFNAQDRKTLGQKLLELDPEAELDFLLRSYETKSGSP